MLPPKKENFRLNPSDQSILEKEMINYANEGASDEDLIEFKNTFLSEKKKSIKESTSTTPPQKLVSETKVGSLDGIKSIDKNFKMFPDKGELTKSTTPKFVLPKINTDLQEAINKPENVAKRKEFLRQELFKSRENTKLKENEKQETQNDLLAKKQQQGVWNNVVAIGKDLVSKASDLVFSMTDEQVTPEDLKIDKDPLSTEKKQAKDSLRSQGVVNPKKDEIDVLADEIYLDNANTEKKQQKINAYLKGLDEQTKGILQVDAETRFKTLSKSKQDLTNRISLNEKYFNELQDDLSNPKLSEQERLFAKTKSNKILKYLKKDHAEFSKNNEELGTAEDEFNAFKRNYNALDNTASRVKLSLANAGLSLYSGANYIANSLGANEEYKQEGIQKAKTFLEEEKNSFRPDNKDITLDNFFQYSTDLLANQSGTMAQIATGGVGGVVALGVEGAGDKYTEMYQDKKNGKNYSPNQMLITPFASGLFTAVLSEVPTLGTLKNSANVWKSAFKETVGKELISNAIKNTSESIVKNIYRDTKKEVLTESIDNILQNAIKKDIQGDNSVGYFDNSLKTITDTGLLTGMIGSSGAMPHIAISAVKTFSEKSQAKSLDINAKKISNLLSKLNDINVNDATKKVIKDQIDLATKENSETINKTIDKMGKMPLNQIEIVYNNSKRLAEIERETIDIKDDFSLEDSSKLILLNGLKEEYKSIEETNLNIINGKTSPVESLPLKELESFKKQASNELIKELNPEGTKNIKIDNEQITERANKIYSKQIKDAETKSSVTNEAQPEAEIQEQTKAEKVEKLRAEEQVELKEALPNAELKSDGKIDIEKLSKEDTVVYDEVYNKYDKLITPLLENEGTQASNTFINGDFRPTATNVGESGNTIAKNPISESVPSSVNGGEAKSDVEYTREQVSQGILEWDGDIFSPRIDLGMTWADIRKGQADLAKGKENTVPAKRLVEAITKAKEEGGYRYKFGTGGESERATKFVTFEDMQKNKNEYNLTDAEQKEIIDNEVQYAKEYDDYFNSLDEETQNEILDNNENKSTEISGNTTSGESKVNVSSEEKSEGEINEGSAETRQEVNNNFDKNSFKTFASIVPNGEVGVYLSGKTIEKYTGNKPENNQEIFKVKLDEALVHGVSTIEKAKEKFGDDFVSKTLDFLEQNTISPESKALTYISLENELVKQQKNGFADNLTIQKQLNQVREVRQSFARSNSLALNMNRLQKFAELGYDINKDVSNLFTTKQKEAKAIIEDAIQHTSEDINKQDDLEFSESVSPELKDLIQEGIDKQINEIYKKLPSSRRLKADNAIKALENIQKGLRSKTYDASIGIPVAIINAGITVIKNSIKAGVNVADAIELGISHIKEKYGKDWSKEDEFRKDFKAGFKSYNIELKDQKKDSDASKEIVNQALIDAGYFREIKIKGEAVKRLDWVKLAGTEGSIDNIKSKVEGVLSKDKNYSEKDVNEIKKTLEDEYNRLGAEIIEKSLNELEKRNLIKPSPKRKSEAKRLAELYNFGLLEKNQREYDNLLNKTLGLSDFEQKVFEKIQGKSKALADIFNSENNGKKLTEQSIQSIASDLNHDIKELLNAVSFKEGDLKYKVITLLTDYAGLSQKALLGGLPNLIENVTSGRFAGLEQNIFTNSVITPELAKQIKKDKKIIYDDITKNAGLYYGDTNTSLVSSSRFEDWINGKTDNKVTHAVISTITLRSWLDGADSRAKLGLSSKLFVKNAVDILTSKTNPNGSMSKDEAVKFVSESLTGDKFEKALVTAKSIIDDVNSKQEVKQLRDNEEAVYRFAMNLVKENLMQDSRMSIDEIDVAFKSGYKSAGRDLGHEANNTISKGVNLLNSTLNTELEKAVSEKRYPEATAIATKLMIMRSIVNPFVGGGTNWVILGLEKSGNPLGYISTYYNSVKRTDLDLSTISGVKNMSESLYRKNNYQASVVRNIVGTSVALSMFLAFSVKGSDDENGKEKLNKWLKDNKWAKRYFDKLAPESLTLMMSIKNDELGKHMAKVLGMNGDTFNNTSKLLKSLDDDKTSTKGKIGQVIGSPLNSPLAWKTVKDVQNIIRGVQGRDEIKTDYKSSGFWNGYFQGGLTEFLGMRPDKENTSSNNGTGIKPKKLKKFRKF